MSELAHWIFGIELSHNRFRECNNELFLGFRRCLWYCVINHVLVEYGPRWLNDSIDLPLDLFIMLLLVLDFLLELAPIVGVDEVVGLVPLDDQLVDLLLGLFGHRPAESILA